MDKCRAGSVRAPNQPARSETDSMTETPDRHDFALDLIVSAGRLAMDYFARLATLETESKKDGQDVVSAADRAVEDLIRDAIHAVFPSDGILGEERSHEPGTSGWLWVVDPIDGTSCVLAGLRDWCISIAAMKDGEADSGCILQPVTGDLYAARRGGGATLNGAPILASATARIETNLLGFGANFRIPRQSVIAFADALMASGGMFYRNGSGALMLAYVAAGRLCGYYEGHINAWDCMAGLLLVREAGGWTMPFPGPGRELTEGGPVLCGPAHLEHDLLALAVRAGHWT